MLLIIKIIAVGTVGKYNGGGIQAGMLFLPEKIHAFLLAKE